MNRRRCQKFLTTFHTLRGDNFASPVFTKAILQFLQDNTKETYLPKAWGWWLYSSDQCVMSHCIISYVAKIKHSDQGTIKLTLKQPNNFSVILQISENIPTKYCKNKENLTKCQCFDDRHPAAETREGIPGNSIVALQSCNAANGRDSGVVSAVYPERKDTKWNTNRGCLGKVYSLKPIQFIKYIELALICKIINGLDL